MHVYKYILIHTTVPAVKLSAHKLFFLSILFTNMTIIREPFPYFIITSLSLFSSKVNIIYQIFTSKFTIM